MNLVVGYDDVCWEDLKQFRGLNCRVYFDSDYDNKVVEGVWHYDSLKDAFYLTNKSGSLFLCMGHVLVISFEIHKLKGEIE